MRARRPVVQTGLALGPEPIDPAVGALTGDPLRLRGVGDGPPLFTDTLDQQLPASHVQAGITVGHRLAVGVTDLALRVLLGACFPTLLSGAVRG